MRRILLKRRSGQQNLGKLKLGKNGWTLFGYGSRKGMKIAMMDHLNGITLSTYLFQGRTQWTTTQPRKNYSAHCRNLKSSLYVVEKWLLLTMKEFWIS